MAEGLELQTAIALVSSSADPRVFGTGFVVHEDGEFSYLVTCAHVLRDIEKKNGETDKILAEDSVATVVARGDCDAIDLAVLRVDRWYRRSPVALSIAMAADRPVEIVGHREYSGAKGAWERRITGRLERPLRQKLNGQVIPAWDLLLPPDELQPGYSGSPVIDRETGTVVAVTNIQRGKERGIAIGVEALGKIWPEMPSGLIEGLGAGRHGESDTRPAQRVMGWEVLPAVPVWAGRDRLVAELGPLLRAGGELRVVALVAQGGMGKSALAVKLLEAVGVELGSGEVLPEFGARGFGRAIAFKAFEGTSFDEVAAHLLSGLGVAEGRSLMQPADKVAAIVQALAEEPALVVLDNLESVLHPARHPQAGRAIEPAWGELLAALATGNHRSLVVLTSREEPADLAGRRFVNAKPNRRLVRLVVVDEVDVAGAITILRENGMEDSEADLGWIAERVQGHPFVLELLARNYADRPGYLRRHPALLTGELDVDQLIRSQLVRQSAAAQDLLQRMALLRVAIEARGLTYLRLYTADREQDERFEIAAIRGKPAEFTAEEIAETHELLRQLTRASLVQRRYDPEACEEFFDLHRVVVEFLQRELGKAQEALLRSVYRFYCTGKSLDNPKTLDDLQPLLEAQYFAFQLGNYSEAEDLIYQLENYLEPWGYWTLLKDLLEKVLPQANQHSKPYILGRIGIRHREWGDWDTAERYFKEALELNTELGDHAGIAISCALLGDIEQNRGNWEASERLYQQYLEVCTELDDRAGMATSWGVLGDIERKRGNWDTAKRYFKEALELDTELGDGTGMAISWSLLGEIERNGSNWEAAERLYRQSLELRTELGDRWGIAGSKADFGELELDRGNLDKAEEFLTQSLEEFEALKAQREIAYVEFRLAQVWQKRGNLPRAKPHRTRARDLYQQLGAAKDLERIETEWQKGE